MTETHEAEAHHGPNLATYLVIFFALSIFTVLSFLINAAFGPGNVRGALLILLVAVIKACLVGAIFMHLKYDWSRLYFLICPVFIMAMMMMVVLLPDTVLAWHREAAEGPGLVKSDDTD